MGNEAVQKQRNRYRTLDHINQSTSLRKSYRRPSQLPSQRSNLHVSLDHQQQSSRIMNTINNGQNHNNDQSLIISNRNSNNGVRTISRRSYELQTPSKDLRQGNNSEKDRILRNLSEKNEDLRKELKKISEELTEKLKRKKFVPKKQIKQEEENAKVNAGLKKELENGYKQINMYKKTLDGLRGRSQNQEAVEIKIQRLENQMVGLDAKILESSKKAQGLRKVQGGQDRAIEKDLNQQLHQGVGIYKHELQEMKNKLKEIAKKDRQREANYKKQQAYLCEVQKKLRIINDSYFVQRKEDPKPPKKSLVRKTASSDKNSLNNDPTFNDFQEINTELQTLRAKHEEYHKKIDLALGAKNKQKKQNKMALAQLQKKEQIIKNLLTKLEQAKKLNRPPLKKNLFGGYEQTMDMMSDDNQSVGEKPKQPDQFDIQHLLSNIPKPVREKPAMIEIQSPTRKKKGVIQLEQIKKTPMLVTMQKSQPKKWDNILSRSQEHGKFFKGQLTFADSDQFDDNSQPLIVGINIWVDLNNSILGFQAIYMNNEDIRYGYKSSSASQGTILHYDLNRPDYLKNLTGAFGPEGFIEYLVFSSKQGKIGKFGIMRTEFETFNFGMSSSERPFLLSGASSLYEGMTRVNRIGLEICGQE